jgi:hypothetical protein
VRTRNIALILVQNFCLSLLISSKNDNITPTFPVFLFAPDFLRRRTGVPFPIATCIVSCQPTKGCVPQALFIPTLLFSYPFRASPIPTCASLLVLTFALLLNASLCYSPINVRTLLCILSKSHPGIGTSLRWAHQFYAFIRGKPSGMSRGRPNLVRQIELD